MGNPIPLDPVTIAAPVVSVVEQPVINTPSISPNSDLILGGGTKKLFGSSVQEAKAEPIVLVSDPTTLGVVDVNQIENEGREVVLLPKPLATTVSESKLKGNWYDEQKLSLETFKEVVATDVDNVWVVAYVDPRCRDCLSLSIEWERLTQIEEKVKRKVKLGYVDISVTENWRIIQDHTKGKKLTHTPQVTLYGSNKETPHFYEEEEHPSADGVHSWVSSYADRFGYGYWDPDMYQGTSAIPNCMFSDDGCPFEYRVGPNGIYAFDTKKHEGALGKAGVGIGPKGKGY